MNRLLAWGSDLIAKHPLTLLALCALCGIVVADHRPQAFFAYGLTGLVCLLVGMWLPYRALACGAAFCVFALHHSFRWQETFGHPLRGVDVGAEGVAVEAVGEFLNGPTAAGAALSRHVMFRARQIRLPSMGMQISGETILKLSGAVFARRFVAKGGLYKLSGTLMVERTMLNPTLGDAERFDLRAGMVGRLNVSAVTHEQHQFSLRLWMLERAERCRAWIAAQVALGMEDDPETTAILQTMALGTSGTDTSELEKPFVESGTMHVFAVSGLHVGLIGVLGWIVLKTFRVRRHPALCLLIPLVIGYAFVTGWRPSAARAACMLTLMLIAPLFMRRGRAVNALGLSALLLWAVDTHELYDAGFQLSFFVLWSIAALAEPIARPFQTWAALDEFLPVELASWKQRLGATVREWFVSMGSTSVAAWLGSAPLMFAWFRTITPVGLLANLVLVPLSFMALSCISLSLLAAAAGMQQVQMGFNHASWALAKAMRWSATRFASVPYGHMTFLPEQVVDDGMPTLVIPALRPAESAALLKADGVRWMLDCGSRRSYLHVVEPMLQRHGVKKVDGVILSHADADHAGGAALLFAATPARRLIIPMHEPWHLDSRATTLWRLTRERSAADAELFRAQGGEVFDLSSSVKMHVLHPLAKDIADKADDRAMVVRMEIGAAKVLWVNDAGLPTEKHLLQRMLKRELRAAVLWRGQHANDVSATPEFLAAVKPKVVITSNDPDDPAEAMPKLLKEYCTVNGVHLLNLQECGQVTLRVVEEGIHLHTHVGNKEFTITP